MCQFLETIQLRDGEFKRLAWHQRRMNKAMSDYYPEATVPILAKKLSEMIFPIDGLYKCRVIYDTEIRKIEFLPYTLPVIRTLKMLDTDMASLPYKMADRSGYQTLFVQKAECDDVLLVKDGLLTDTSYCNIALYDGINWITPLEPLIRGVNREELLDEGRLIAKDISMDALKNFQRIRLFNALIEFGEIELDVSSVCR